MKKTAFHILLFQLVISIIFMDGFNVNANASTTNSPISASLPSSSQLPTTSGGNQNPIFQLLGYVKDSFVRMKDGSVQLYTNHQRCNTIRSKQREYLSITASRLPETQQKQAKQYTINAGGITYEEFDFLLKGKDDRGRLANIIFMMVFAPNFVPYAFMFFPEMLPSPFAMSMNKGPLFNKMEIISRERAHCVLQTMIDVERSSRVAPIISNLNPFGKGKTKRMMERMDKLSHACGALLSADGAVGKNGAELLMKVLEDEIYTKDKPNKSSTSLTTLPKAVVKGLGKALEAPATNQFLPAFILRGKVLNCLTQITASDEFLVDQNVDLGSLSSELLEEACSKRLIGGPGRSHKEMIDGLSSWLDMSVRQPEEKVKTGLHYNGNLARAALLSYNAVDAARDPRTSSFLPRLVFQGQLYASPNMGSLEGSQESIESTKLIEKSQRWLQNKK